MEATHLYFMAALVALFAIYVVTFTIYSELIFDGACLVWVNFRRFRTIVAVFALDTDTFLTNQRALDRQQEAVVAGFWPMDRRVATNDGHTVNSSPGFEGGACVFFTSNPTQNGQFSLMLTPLTTERMMVDRSNTPQGR